MNKCALYFRLLGSIAVLASVAWVSSAAEINLIKISHDPYQDSVGQHATEVEPVMVAHDDTVVSAFQVGRFLGAGAENIGWSTSMDGGKNWRSGFLVGTTLSQGGQWPAISLPVIAHDKKHDTYLIAMMPFDANGDGRGVLISRSADGLHWGAPILAASSGGAAVHWLACDNYEDSPFYGSCYDAYLDYSSPPAYVNFLVVSRDGGRTWSSPIPSPDRNAGLPTSIAIQPSGHVVILGRTGGPNGDQAYAISSSDGGRSLDATVDIATAQFDYPYLRADPNLSSAVDASGKIFVVFPDCRFRSNCVDPGCRYGPSPSLCATNDLLLTTSNDGQTWSLPERIPIDSITSSVDHFITGLGALSERHCNVQHRSDSHCTKLALTYYFESNANLPDGTPCIPTSCLVSAGSISSDDGGNSWNPAHRIGGPMVESSLVPTYAGEMVADYISAVFVQGQPFGAFALARTAGGSQTLDEAIYATPLPEGRE